MVHETLNPGVKKIAVVGLFYKVGPPDAFISKVQTPPPSNNFELIFSFKNINSNSQIL
jgi:hypothetical protein